jgi:hypothetical protein
MLPLPAFEKIKKLSRINLETAFIANWWVADVIAHRLCDLATAFARIDQPAAVATIEELRRWVIRDVAILAEKSPDMRKPLEGSQRRILEALNDAELAAAETNEKGH